MDGGRKQKKNENIVFKILSGYKVTIKLRLKNGKEKSKWDKRPKEGEEGIKRMN